MKQQLQSDLGDKIIISEINGKPNVVTFRSSAANILSEFKNKQLKDSEDAKQQIIKTAAKLIKCDIKAIKQFMDTYPTFSEMSSTEAALTFIPESLKTFLQTIFSGKKY